MKDVQQALPDPEDFRIRVLLVDDQAMVGAAVQRMLEPEGDIDFHFCQDPKQAVAQAAEFKPTVILQDLVMPDIEGMTLVRFFRAHPELKEVPLIVLSTKEEAVTKADAFAAGANDYLVKLPDRIELVARIRYHSKGYINLLQRNAAYSALVAKQEELAGELARAADYCVSLLPDPLTEGAIQTQWKFVPSAKLGGDSFGYHWIDDDHFAIYLLDVCDHGVGSALLSVSALNVLREQTLPEADFRDPSSVLTLLNEAFQMEKHNGLYFTIWYGVYNRTTGALRYANAGHPPALLMPESGETEELMSRNLVLGGMPGIQYKSEETIVTKPAQLYVFSDGVYEITHPDGSLWKFEEFRQYMEGMNSRPEAVPDALYHHVMEMGQLEILDDDFSMLRISFGA